MFKKFCLTNADFRKVLIGLLAVVIVGGLTGCSKERTAVSVSEIDNGVEPVSGISIQPEHSEREDEDDGGAGLGAGDPYIEEDTVGREMLLALSGLEEERTFLTEPVTVQKEVRESLQYEFMNSKDIVSSIGEGQDLVLYNDGRIGFVFSNALWNVIKPDMMDSEDAATAVEEYKIGLSGKEPNNLNNIVTFSLSIGAGALEDLSKSLYTQLEDSKITDVNLVVDQANDLVVGMGVFHNDQTDVDCVATAISGFYQGNTYLVLAIADPSEMEYGVDVQRILATFIPF